MKVKVGDNVKIIAGKDKGKEGKVIKTLKKKNHVVVEGINICKRHSKPRTNEDKGGIIDIEASLNVSNVKVINATAKKTKQTPKKEEKEIKKTVAKKTVAKKTEKKETK
ncbi:MAG: 50S ribosomal protein L24 [Mollicutes bacterium]|nr:50S ribosomal protein L24 [Mollicutes bacterium]